MPAPVAAGELVAGKFRVERILGEGGMGVVVAATHLDLDQKVALKFLRAEAAQDPERRARFLREARAAAKIQSEHVARVTDVSALDDGTPYMVMEYLEGADLDAVLTKEGPLDVPTAVTYVREACAAVAEAHRAGVIHRDLKPANLFLAHRPDGSACVKVLDFGISKVSRASVALTKDASFLGTPVYTAPEQLRSARDVDTRADIWALGVILFELTTGDVPFQAGTVAELCAAIIGAEPRRLRELRPELPAALEAIVARCLEKAPDARFATVSDLAAALAPLAPEGARAAVPRVASPARRVSDPAAATMVDEPSRRHDELAETAPAIAPAPRARPRWHYAAAAAVGAIAAALVARSGTPAATAPSSALPVAASAPSASGSAPTPIVEQAPPPTTAPAPAMPASSASARRPSAHAPVEPRASAIATATPAPPPPAVPPPPAATRPPQPTGPVDFGGRK